MCCSGAIPFQNDATSSLLEQYPIKHILLLGSLELSR